MFLFSLPLATVFVCVQLSAQQVVSSLRSVGVSLDKAVFGRWLKAADTIGRGIYSVPVLLDTMERARPVFLDNRVNSGSGENDRDSHQACRPAGLQGSRLTVIVICRNGCVGQMEVNEGFQEPFQI